ncbi:MAG: ABC transporter substrate-binding protein [Promethearchaeota archaeon]|nr:MAG: ABC transporter substrate-binding protein [Candidatus Lokiarchaeota archaeon]
MDENPKKKRKLFKSFNNKQKIGLGTTSIIAIAAIIGGIYFYWELQETPESVFICGLASAPDSIDPLQNPGPNYANLWIWDQIAEGLFDYNKSKTNSPIIPNLALNGNWSSDHLNFTCELRRNVTFHDGTPFNATAVKWNFDRIYKFIEIMPYDDIWAWEYAYHTANKEPIINHTEIIDDYTIRFVLNQPYVPIRDLLAVWTSYILSPASTPEDEFIDIRTGRLVGTGPFIFDYCEVNIYGYAVKTEMHANPDYWDGTPSFNKLVFLRLDSSERMERMLSGELSYAEGSYNNETLEIYKNDPGISVISFSKLGFRYIGLDNNKFNITMRKAISYAFNYTCYLKEFSGGHSIRVKSPLAEKMRYSHSGLFDVPYYNITIARQVLKNANWPGTDNLTANNNITAGNEWEIVANSSKPLATYNYSIIYGSVGQQYIANITARDLKQIGVKVNIVELANVEWWNKLNNGELDFFIAGWGPALLDPVETIDPLFSNSINAIGNVYNFNDTTVQKWIDDAIIEFNETKREQLYFNIQQRLIEQLYPVVWLDFPITYDIWNSDLRGIPIEGAPLKYILKTIYSS